MAELTTKKRKKLAKDQFALPAQKRYPINDKAHAANAKARAKQQFNAGNISQSTMNRIDAAANKVLKGK